MGRCPHTGSITHTPLLPYPPHLKCQLLVSCCLLLLNGGHLRPRPVVEFVGPNKGPTAARASLMQCAGYGPIWSRGRSRRTKLWGHGACSHRERGQIRWGVGRLQIKLVVVCFMLCFVVDHKVLLATVVVESQTGASQNGQFLRNHNIKIPPNRLNIRGWIELFLL